MNKIFLKNSLGFKKMLLYIFIGEIERLNGEKEL